MGISSPRGTQTHLIRGCDPTEADPDEFGWSKCAEVHRAGNNPAQGPGGETGSTGCHLTFFRHRHRHWYLQGWREKPLSILPTSGQFDDATLRRHGAGPGHQQTAGRVDGGHDVVESEPGAGSTFFFTVQMKEPRERSRRRRRFSGFVLLADPFLPMEETNPSNLCSPPRSCRKGAIVLPPISCCSPIDRQKPDGFGSSPEDPCWLKTISEPEGAALPAGQVGLPCRCGDKWLPGHWRP